MGSRSRGRMWPTSWTGTRTRTRRLRSRSVPPESSYRTSRGFLRTHTWIGGLNTTHEASAVQHKQRAALRVQVGLERKTLCSLIDRMLSTARVSGSVMSEHSLILSLWAPSLLSLSLSPSCYISAPSPSPSLTRLSVIIYIQWGACSGRFCRHERCSQIPGGRPFPD